MNFGGPEENKWLTFHQIGNLREHDAYWYLTEIFRSNPPRPALNGEPYYAGMADKRYPPYKYCLLYTSGLVPSGNSLALTYPGVFGSRVGGVRWASAASAGFTPAIKFNTAQSNAASWSILASFIFILSRAGGITFNQPIFPALPPTFHFGTIRCPSREKVQQITVTPYCSNCSSAVTTVKSCSLAAAIIKRSHGSS